MRRFLLAACVPAVLLVYLSCDAGPPASSEFLSGTGTAGGGNVLSDRMTQAAMTGNRKAVEAFLPHVSVNATDPQGRTMLMLAAYDGHATTVRLLCENKADPNLRDANRRTALMYASSGPNSSTVEILLAHGAEVNVADGEEGWTALMFAAAEGHSDIVRMLLDKGADPRLTDIDGESAESFARSNGHENVVAVLTKSTQQ